MEKSGSKPPTSICSIITTISHDIWNKILLANWCSFHSNWYLYLVGWPSPIFWYMCFIFPIITTIYVIDAILYYCTIPYFDRSFPYFSVAFHFPVAFRVSNGQHGLLVAWATWGVGAGGFRRVGPGPVLPILGKVSLWWFLNFHNWKITISNGHS